jgi:hypothetical protein
MRSGIYKYPEDSFCVTHKLDCLCNIIRRLASPLMSLYNIPGQVGGRVLRDLSLWLASKLALDVDIGSISAMALDYTTRSMSYEIGDGR